MQRNISALFNACLKEHRGGAGGAAMCICGAGCGGSEACSALELLKQAMAGPDDYRAEVAEMFGWESETHWPKPRTIRTVDTPPATE